MRLFVFGLGYVGERLASSTIDAGWKVVGGTCSSSQRAQEVMKHLGGDVPIWSYDGTADLSAEALCALDRATHVLCTVPPVSLMDGQKVDPVIHRHVARLASHDRSWIGYLSSTGVYGDWQGAWVTEECEPKPEGPTAVARLAAEQAWIRLLDLNVGTPLHIFRLAGIYGPGTRNALKVLLDKGLDLAACGVDLMDSAPISRVHVDDIVQVLMRSMADPDPPSRLPHVYNVADHEPASRAMVFTYAVSLLRTLDLEGQQQVKPQPSQVLGSKRRSQGLKRIDNSKMMRRFFGDSSCLRYPTYQAGLEAILKESLPPP